MHDPKTVSFEIYLGSKKKKNGDYRNAFITIWHNDPEKDGTDDSCGWCFPKITKEENEYLDKVAKDQYSQMFSRKIALIEKKSYAHILYNQDTYGVIYWMWRHFNKKFNKVAWQYGKPLSNKELNCIYELSTNPEQLKSMTREQIFAKTPELGRTMVGQLLKKKADIDSSPEAVNIDNNQLKQIAAEYGIKNKDKLGKVEHDISILIDAEQGRLGKKLSYTEKEDFIRKAMVKIPVETKGALWGTNVKEVPLYELNKIKETGNIKIPAADRKIIVDSLVKNGVTEPTEAQILNGYILLKKK